MTITEMRKGGKVKLSNFSFPPLPSSRRNWRPGSSFSGLTSGGERGNSAGQMGPKSLLLREQQHDRIWTVRTPNAPSARQAVFQCVLFKVLFAISLSWFWATPLSSESHESDEWRVKKWRIIKHTDKRALEHGSLLFGPWLSHSCCTYLIFFSCYLGIIKTSNSWQDRF